MAHRERAGGKSARTSSGSFSRRMKLATELRSLPTAAAICFLRQRELIEQPLIGQRFVDRVEVLALDVLDQRELEQLLVPTLHRRERRPALL